MTTALTVEVMSSSNVWTDITAGVKNASIQVGLVGQRYAYPQSGKCVLTLDNSQKAYNVAQAIAIDTGTLDARRRVRVRATGASLGKEMQATMSGTGAVGGTLTITSDNLASANYNATTRFAQSFKVINGGILTQWTYDVVANTFGGTIHLTWELHSYDTTQPGNIGKTVLASGVDVFGPSSPAIKTVTVTSGPYLQPNVNYQLVTWIADYTSGTETISAGSVDGYADGVTQKSTDNGLTWGAPGFLGDMALTFTTASVVEYWSQVVTTATSVSDVWTLQWDARAAYDSQYNADSVNIVTSGETGAATIKTYTNKWKTYSITFTATHTGTTIEPRFAPQYVGNGQSSTAIEYRKITLKKGAGSNVLTNGDFSSGSTSPWAVHNAGSTTLTLAVTNDYWTLYQGFIETIQPSQGLFGDLQTVVTCVDWVEIFKLQNISTVLKENVTSDQLISYALSFLTPLTFNATIPGQLLDTGTNTFDRVFDTNTQSTTSILEVMTNAAMSDFGRVIEDRDGTVRFYNRNKNPLAQNTASKLTLAAGQAWAASQQQPIKDISTIINSVVLTYHPRVVGGSVQVLGTATSSGAVTIPAKNSSGAAGQATITITYRDTASTRLIGGKNQVNPLVAQTDIKVTDNPNGTGFDYTTSNVFSFTQADSASQTTLVMSNTAIGPLYASLLQVRGNPVTQYDPIQITVKDATSISTYQERTFTQDLLYGTDQQFATALANWLVFNYKYPFLEFGGVKIDSLDTFNSVDLLSLELFDYITVSDTQTNISSMKHVIIGVNYELNPNNYNAVASVEFITERVDYHNYCILDDATYGVLDSTNLLYI